VLGSPRARPHPRRAGRAAAAGLAALALVVAGACTDQRDTPDVNDPTTTLATLATVTVPPFADCSGESPVDPCVTPSDDLSATSIPAPIVDPATAPPETCGPDDDEQHPPPCD